ncbi:VOC family protein [Kibdelosporangium philippinense]|uniref:VOC family protein n=1 Tax=Kibdelosporangium philippinense TaxID=211113 RepID=A0ABS8Z4A7_9PSEU|nr:VOC family protein [Kibdelosporangium philippinense]MCE7001413.1 VOC family protein [Kibdelosporangium philippinense]
MARLRDIVIDCKHPASLARFWAALLDDYEIAPYDDAELARLGIDSPEDDPSVLLQRLDGGAPRIFLTRVPEPKTVKNRVHLDVDGDVDAVLALGATLVAKYDDHDLLTDPEGNEFCVFP